MGPPQYSQDPVGPSKHPRLPIQQDPRQPQGLVTSTQHPLKHTDGQGRPSPVPDPLLSPGGPPLTLAVL